MTANLGRIVEVGRMLVGISGGGMDATGWLLMIALWGASLVLVLWAITRLFPAAGSASRQAAQLSERVAMGDAEWDRSTNFRAARAGGTGRG